jgi:pimeloyl-ACP methyl ester carboxylesterase
MPFVSNAGIRIHYQVEGDGPPLFLHAGFLTILERWYETGYVEALKDDYQLILIDPRGQGRSDKPHEPEAYDLPRFVDDIVAVLDELSLERVHFWGYSMGGQIGFAAGVFAPDRFHSLILGGSDPYFEDPATVVLPTVAEEVIVLRQGMPAFIQTYEEHYGPLPLDVRQQWLNFDAEAMAANTLATEHYPIISDHLAEVTLPTLIYCGTDELHFEKSHRAAATMPNAMFVSLEGLNHAQAFRRSDLILPHVRTFLQQLRVTA